VSEREALVARVWRDGVGPDDRLDALDPAVPGVALFAALARVSRGERVAIPAAPATAAERVLHAAIVIRDGVLARAREAIQRGVDDLTRALPDLADDDPHAVAARAWADLALGEVALLVGNPRVAHHRFEAVANVASAPVAIRIEAMRQLIGLAVQRGDLEAARVWGTKGISLSERHDRPIQAAWLRRHGLLLSYAVGDVAGVARAIEALATDDPEIAKVGQLLLATTEATLEATLEETRARGDGLLYALCLLIGVRRHLVAGQPDEALALIEAGVQHLQQTAPQLVKILEEVMA